MALPTATLRCVVIARQRVTKPLSMRLDGRRLRARVTIEVAIAGRCSSCVFMLRTPFLAYARIEEGVEQICQEVSPQHSYSNN